MPDKPAAPDAASAEAVLPAGRLPETLAFFLDELGFRLDAIAPADDPAIARLSGYGLRLRLDSAHRGEGGILRLNTMDGRRLDTLIAPNGTRIEFGLTTEPVIVPEPEAGLCIQRFEDRDGLWKSGRAGMRYRDLIPDRAGGYLIASHIRIPAGGPVPDSVHYHGIRFQLIYCCRGWVRLVYEDQGGPFLMRAGDCVLQPPYIRHRVLEASEELEVIESTSPADHMTYLDHDMRLPTGRHLPSRDYSGQKFVFHQAEKARWRNGPEPGFETRDFGIAEATGGLARARVVRRIESSGTEAGTAVRNEALAFTFVLRGRLNLVADGRTEPKLTGEDAFVIPKGMKRGFENCSDDLELLEISLPA